MRISILTFGLVALGIATTSVGQTIVLINETFNPTTFVPNPNPPLWSSSIGPALEVYDSSGAGARGMASTYDHDNNGGTAQITIPGGLEVNDNGNNVTVTTQRTLPATFNTSSGLLTFWAGSRGNVAGQTISIFDVTDSTTILGPTNVNFNTNGQWLFNSFNVPFTAAHWGDTIQVRFHGIGNGGQGLQVADLDFTVSALVPEPTSIALWSLLGVGLVVGGYHSIRRK